MKKARLEKYLPAILLFFLSLILLLVSSLTSMGNDEGMWTYMGRIWVENHLPPYLGSVENKTPGIFILNAVSHYFFGIAYMPVRILGVVATVFSSYLLYRIAYKLHSRFAGLLAMLIFGFAMSWKTMHGAYSGQTETFMVFFTIVGLYFLLMKKSSTSLLLCGISMGFAIAFKQVALLTCVPLFLFLLFGRKEDKLKIQSLKPVLLFFMGVLAATATSILPLLFSGEGFMDYIEGAWLILLQKGSTVPMDLHIENFNTVWTSSRIVLCYPFLLLIGYVLWQKKDRILNLLAFILLFDFIAVNLSGNYYGHQFKQLLPAFCLLTALSISYFVDFFVFKTKLNLIFATLALTGIYFFPLGQLTEMEKIKDPFDEKLTENDPAKKIGEWVKTHTLPHDYIYTPNYHYNAILSYSERRSPSEYFNFIFVNGKTEISEVLDDLAENPPKLIIGKMPADNFYPAIKKYREENYVKIKTLNGIPIFEKKETTK